MEANSKIFRVQAHEGEVIIMFDGPRPGGGSFTPEAILGSLDLLRLAAEEAIRQRRMDGLAAPNLS